MIDEIFWEYCHGGLRLVGIVCSMIMLASAEVQVWEQLTDHTAKRLINIGAGLSWMARMEDSSKID